jgi:peptide/histidine transporter 3/4
MSGSEEVLTDLTELNEDAAPNYCAQWQGKWKRLDHIKSLCLKSRYQMRRLKNKGAILIVFWNFLVWSVYNSNTNSAFGLENITGVHNNLSVLFFVVQAIGGAILMPLVGWLADVRIGRFKVIRWSFCIMWVSSLVMTLSCVLAQAIESYNGVHTKLSLVFVVAMGVGFCGFQANIVQFGVDQLLDASTIEITSFIAWYAGSFLSGRFAISFVLSCAPNYPIFGSLLISFSLSTVMITYFLFNRFLVKEPASSINPFRLVYHVIKYAAENKCPKQRSAFTYYEDYLPSRIDFGKRKYGGPFTTEQVEDVKTLFRSLLIAVVITAFYGTTYHETEYMYHLKKSLLQKPPESGESTVSLQLQCFSEYTSFTGTYFVAALVLIPLNEFLLYPLLHRYLPYLNIYKKFILGAVLRLGKYLTLMALTVYTRQVKNSAGSSMSNATLLCLFQATPGSLTNTIDSRWFILPQILHSLSDLLIVITMIEFFCAQIPYSMKGIVAGIAYGLLGVFVAITKAVSIPFMVRSVHWGVGTISCEFWYLLMKALFLMLVTILSLIARRYKLRKREDVLPNEQIFAERFYSRDNN